MANVKSFQQGPTEKVKYGVNVSAGDTVASAVWTASPPLTIDQTVNAADSATARVTGVQMNKTHMLTCHLTGASGQEWDRSCYIHGTQL